jgi:hypothetical protein
VLIELCFNFVILVGIIVIFLAILAAVLGGLLPAFQEKTISPVFVMFENDSCKVAFSNARPAPEKNALFLNKAAWEWKANNCSKVWSTIYELETLVIELIYHNRISEAINVVNNWSSSGKNPIHVLGIIALIQKQLFDIFPNMVNFASQLTSKMWRFQIYHLLQEQMYSFNYPLREDLLSFAFHLSKETDEVFAKFKSEADKQQNIILNSACMQNRLRDLNISHLSAEVWRSVMPKFIAKCFEMLKTGAVNRLLKPIGRLPSTTCFGYHLLYQYLKKTDSLGSTAAFIVRVFSQEAIDKAFNEIEMCRKVVMELKKFEMLQDKAFLELYDHGPGEWKNVHPYNISIHFPALIKHKYNMHHHNDNLSTLMKFLWGDAEFLDEKCIGSLALVEQMKSLAQLATVEGIALLSNVKHYGDFNQIECTNIRNLVPEWLKVFLFEQPTSCKFTENEACSAEFTDNLKMFLFDGAKRHLPVGGESLFVYFVLNNLTSSIDLSQKIENFTTLVSSWKRDLAQAVVKEYKTKTSNKFDLLDKRFSTPFLRYALKFAADCVYKAENKDSIKLALKKFDTLSSVENVCFGIDYFYQEMERHSELETVEALFLYLYADFVTTVTSCNKDTNRRECHYINMIEGDHQTACLTLMPSLDLSTNLPKGELNKVVKCNHVIRATSNVTKNLMNTYLISWKADNGTVERWHSEYVSAFWAIPKLVKIALHDTSNDKANTARELVKLMSRVSKENHMLLCPGILILNEIIDQYNIRLEQILQDHITDIISVDDNKKKSLRVKWGGEGTVYNYIRSFCSNAIICKHENSIGISGRGKSG